MVFPDNGPCDTAASACRFMSSKSSMIPIASQRQKPVLSLASAGQAGKQQRLAHFQAAGKAGHVVWSKIGTGHAHRTALPPGLRPFAAGCRTRP